MVTSANNEPVKYSKISIPEKMKNEIERIIADDRRLGFVSVQEFVKEAVRGSIVYYGGTLEKNRKI